ncbi:MAG: transcriptional repressor [Clostridiales bacterium]|nr:transcriptional repressor [Clostridiales bacterium]
MRENTHFSEKRQAIYNFLSESKEHPSAETIYNALKPRYPRLSLGTVYRNLMRFKQEGAAQYLTVVDGHERFDGNVSEHAHFVCDKCGAVADLDITLPESINRPAEQGGYEISFRQLFLHGRCPVCATKKG